MQFLGMRVFGGYLLLLLAPFFAYLKMRFPEQGEYLDALRGALGEYLTHGNIAVVLATLALGVKMHLTPRNKRKIVDYLLLALSPVFAFINAKHPELIGVIESLKEALREYVATGTIAVAGASLIGGALLHSAPPPNQSA